MLTIIVCYEAKPGLADAVASALGELVEPTREEPGCMKFAVYRSREEHGRFVIYEQYVDEDAVAAHRETAHYLEMHRIVPPMLADREKGVYDEVAPEAEVGSLAAGAQAGSDRGDAGR